MRHARQFNPDPELFYEDQITSWVEMRKRFSRATDQTQEIKQKYEKTIEENSMIADELSKNIKDRVLICKRKQDNI